MQRSVLHAVQAARDPYGLHKLGWAHTHFTQPAATPTYRTGITFTTFFPLFLLLLFVRRCIVSLATTTLKVSAFYTRFFICFTSYFLVCFYIVFSLCSSIHSKSCYLFVRIPQYTEVFIKGKKKEIQYNTITNFYFTFIFYIFLYSTLNIGFCHEKTGWCWGN